MDLREFVSETLTQIANGAASAAEAVRKVGGVVNPSMVSPGFDPDTTHYFGTFGDGQSVFLIEFDVAVTASDATEGGASAGIKVLSAFSAKIGGSASSTTESTSRIRFKVPLALPVDAKSQGDLLARHQREDEKVRRHNQGIVPT